LPAEDFGERLRLDQGEELLAREFASVTRLDFESQLVLINLAPLEAYNRSSITTAAARSPRPARPRSGVKITSSAS
jgi:hypothetical protein